MKFCSQCDNMYYIKTTSKDSNDLIYYCRNFRTNSIDYLFRRFTTFHYMCVIRQPTVPKIPTFTWCM